MLRLIAGLPTATAACLFLVSLLISSSNSGSTTVTAQTQQIIIQNQIPLTNDNIRSAVRLWLDPINNNRTLVAELYGGASMNDWDTSRITDLTEVFANVVQPGSDHSTTSSSTVDTSSSFTTTTSTIIDRLDGWDVSSVTSLRRAFYNSTGFAAVVGIDLWDVSHVEDMRHMLAHSRNHFSEDAPGNNSAGGLFLSNWTTSALTNMEGFAAFTEHMELNLETWSTAKVTNMNRMLQNTRNFYGGDYLSALDVSSVTSMDEMFANAINVRGARDIATTWDTSSVTSMDRIFYNTTLSYGEDDTNTNNAVPDDADLFYLCWDVSGLASVDNLDHAFCHSNAGGFNCDCVKRDNNDDDDMVHRINTGCNTTRKTCFESLASAGDLAADNVNNNNNNNNNDSNNNGEEGPNLVDAGANSGSNRKNGWSYPFLRMLLLLPFFFW